jgi:arylsulfatase A-like enzyme
MRVAPGSLVLCAAVLTLVALVTPAQAEAQGAPPNVLVVVTDDQPALNTLWVMKKTEAALAQKGTRYLNAFSVTPLCCPSRATIFTGRYAHNTGVISQDPAPLDLTTLLPRLLQEAGYQTAMTGKFLNRWPVGTQPPYFDRWAQICLCVEDPNPLLFNVDGVMTQTGRYSTNQIGNFAVKFLKQFEQDDARPWFLYVAPTAPHWPWVPTPRYAGRKFPRWAGNPAVLEKDLSDKPSFLNPGRYGLKGGQKVRNRQLRELLSVDDMVGRLTTLLTTLREASNTLVIYTSDNGYTWADHGIGGDGGTAGQKRLPYTASAKVPLLVRWPGHVAGGVSSLRLTGTVDIAPTILEAAGIPPDPAKPPPDGRSLLQPDGRDRILLEYWREVNIPTWASIRTRTYQYTEWYEDDDVTPMFTEYYDLVRDPWQLVNLAVDPNGANNLNLPALAAQLAADRACEGIGPPAACP